MYAEENVLPMVFVCLEDDHANCSEAIRLRNELDGRLKKRNDHGVLEYTDRNGRPVPVFVYLPRRQILTKLLKPKRDGADLIPFGSPEHSLGYDRLTADPVKQLATSFANDYDERAWEAEPPAMTDVPDDMHRKFEPPDFDDRPAWARASNLAAAAAINVKLAIVNLKLRHVQEGDEGENSPVVKPSDNDPPRPVSLSRVEHNRYLAERLLAGWRYGEKGTANFESKRRTALVDWNRLPEAERKKDKSQIDEVFRFVRRQSDFILAYREPPPAHQGNLVHSTLAAI